MENKKSRTYYKLLAGFAAAGALFLGGCSGSRGFVSYADINKEYQESVAKLNWPAGYTPPE
ncbi:hypothetical protein KJY77_06145, partial [Canibacter sp. lx-72]